MKLVQGPDARDTPRRTGVAGRTTDPGSSRSSRQVCQTVGYAHSRGVIHRDLKPSNIMVGAFGEVQVMDWGLAKVLPEGGASDDLSAGRIVDETMIQTSRSEWGADGDRSQAGSVLGTPSYMAPEQAVGDVGVVDRRADVFGLGSILCEILTGKRPRSPAGPRARSCNAPERGDTADAFGPAGRLRGGPRTDRPQARLPGGGPGGPPGATPGWSRRG